MSKLITQDLEEPSPATDNVSDQISNAVCAEMQAVLQEPRPSGSVLFCRLPPTNVITEAITLAFYPLFFGIVCTALISGFVGHIVGTAIGIILAIIAITFRRRSAVWADHFMCKIEKAAIDHEDEVGRVTGPHNNWMLLAETSAIFIEVLFLSAVSSIIIANAYFIDGKSFYEFYDFINNYINFIFNNTTFMNRDIEAYSNTPLEQRLFLIKASCFVIITSSLYGFSVMFVRMFVGWRRYWLHLSRVHFQIDRKRERKVFIPSYLFVPIIFLGIYSLFYGGISFFTILHKTVVLDDYMYTSIYKVILYTSGFNMSVLFEVAFIAPYFLLVYFFYSVDSKSDSR